MGAQGPMGTQGPQGGLGPMGPQGLWGRSPQDSKSPGGEPPGLGGLRGEAPQPSGCFLSLASGDPGAMAMGPYWGPIRDPGAPIGVAPGTWKCSVTCGIPLTPTTSSVMQFGHLHTTQVYSTNTQEHIFLTSILAISQSSRWHAL